MSTLQILLSCNLSSRKYCRDDILPEFSKHGRYTSQRLRVFKITFYIKYLALNVYYLLKIHVTVKLLHEVLSHPYPIRQNNKYNAYIPWIYRTFSVRILHASRIYTKNFQKVQGDCTGYRKFCISRSRLRRM